MNRQAQDGKSHPVTTNADVRATQVMNWVVNANGAPQFTLQLPLFPNSNEISVITVDAMQVDQSFHDRLKTGLAEAVNKYLSSSSVAQLENSEKELGDSEEVTILSHRTMEHEFV